MEFLQSGKAKGFEVCFLIRQSPGIGECDLFLRAVLGVCAMVVQFCPRELNMYLGTSSTVNTLSPERLQPKSFSQLETPNPCGPKVSEPIGRASGCRRIACLPV